MQKRGNLFLVAALLLIIVGVALAWAFFSTDNDEPTGAAVTLTEATCAGRYAQRVSLLKAYEFQLSVDERELIKVNERVDNFMGIVNNPDEFENDVLATAKRRADAAKDDQTRLLHDIGYLQQRIDEERVQIQRLKDYCPNL